MKSLRYLVLDCETATLPFADTLANGDSKLKQRLAIAKPLIYDIGWVITNRKGEHLKTVNYLVTEIFSVPSVFNTAYYADKRPIYLDMLNKGLIQLKTWNEIIKELIQDMNTVDSVGAFNSMFDFKKAIPFTELYIKHLYSADYQSWEKVQYSICKNIVDNKTKDNENVFNPNVFTFRSHNYNLFDLWGLAAAHLANNVTYKKECIKNDHLTNSGIWFKTSAETIYQYVSRKYDFVEAHTALDDAMIETFLLSRIAQKHAIDIGITYFPFKMLGDTITFCMRNKKMNKEECEKVYDVINNYILSFNDSPSNYAISLLNKLQPLIDFLESVK